jgi:hypothetical protein
MSNIGETPQDRDMAEEPELEDLDVSSEEADAVSGGTVPSTESPGTRHGA